VLSREFCIQPGTVEVQCKCGGGTRHEHDVCVIEAELAAECISIGKRVAVARSA
jgi:hypothetical protein